MWIFPLILAVNVMEAILDISAHVECANLMVACLNQFLLDVVKGRKCSGCTGGISGDF